MTTATIDITNENEFKSAAERLESLLEEQLELIRRGNIDEVEVIAGETQNLVELISGSRHFDELWFKANRERLRRLYNKICLTLSAQMKDVSQSLSKVNKGKKTVGLYRDNM